MAEESLGTAGAKRQRCSDSQRSLTVQEAKSLWRGGTSALRRVWRAGSNAEGKEAQLRDRQRRRFKRQRQQINRPIKEHG